MSLEKYRFYCLERGGNLHIAEWFKAASDDEALAHIRAKHPDAMCEIWLGERLVATLAAEPSGQNAAGMRDTGFGSTGLQTRSAWS